MTEIVGLRFHDVTEDGSSLSLTFEGRAGELITIAMPTDYLDALLASFGRVKQEVAATRRPRKMDLSFRGLQSWSIASMPGQEYVFMVLDGSTAFEAPYALLPTVAEKFALAMLNASKAVQAQRRDN